MCFDALVTLNTRLREKEFDLGGDDNSFDLKIWLAVYESDLKVFGDLFDESPTVRVHFL